MDATFGQTGAFLVQAMEKKRKKKMKNK